MESSYMYNRFTYTCTLHVMPMDQIQYLQIVLNCTVERPNKGRNRNNLSIKVPNVAFPIVLIHFQPPKRG